MKMLGDSVLQQTHSRLVRFFGGKREHEVVSGVCLK